jgi:hypothetical protein
VVLFLLEVLPDDLVGLELVVVFGLEEHFGGDARVRHRVGEFVVFVPAWDLAEVLVVEGLHAITELELDLVPGVGLGELVLLLYADAPF